MEAEQITTLIFILIFLGPIFAALYYRHQRSKARKAVSESSENLNKLNKKFENYKKETEYLRKYQEIEDAHAEAIIIHQKALNSSITAKNLDDRNKQETHNHIERLQASAADEVRTLKREAKEASDKLKAKAEATLETAKESSRNILDSANKRAEEIAGDALKAKRNAEQYQKAAVAMRNTVKGYGDEYLIPHQSILDDLADEFSHKEAGVELKEARIKTKNMLKNGVAAECDYVEANRKTTALQFIIDAFNGKVDSVLSKVKYNNLGKLKQEILDAFNLVNHNGSAFRSARIEPDYLDARLNELHWAVTTSELKLQEREEQRQIKETMREEERARKEYEKAIKEAEKEEKMLDKAMIQARKQLEGAHDEERQALEQKLAELQTQYDEAEVRNQRAMSMAQQTRRGHVYVISNVGSFGEDVYKIGMTRRLEPLDRVKELGDASVPFGFDVHALINHEDAPALEKQLHRKFGESQVNKVNSRKEFFRVGLAQIREAIEELEIEVHWTMMAEAAEYRESVALTNKAHEQQIQPVIDDETDLAGGLLGDMLPEPI